jgi:hypothetical protein
MLNYPEKKMRSEKNQMSAGMKTTLISSAWVAICSVTLLFSSCEKVEQPYLPWTPPVAPTSDTIRKVLFEDYTGHRCSNCPRVAYAIHNFQETLFPEQVIALAIHSNSAATYTLPDAIHPADFRTTVADKFFMDFGVASLPTGIINRRNKSLGYNTGVEAKWKDTIQKILTKGPDVYMKISNTYDTATGSLTSSIKCSFLNTLPGTYKIIALLTQSEIVSPQDNNNAGNYPPYPSPLATNYKHMHVLRDCIDGTAGSGSLLGKSIVKGDSVTIVTTPYMIPASYPNPPTAYSTPVVIANCHVVAFIFNSITNEVVQVEDEEVE